VTADSRAHSFNSAAAQYEASRPSYPAALFDTVEEFLGRSLTDTRVADIGAGTGIATRLLSQRGAEVLGVEPGEEMAAQFRQALPDVPIVRGDGNTLPLTGALAIWWNTTAFDVPWISDDSEAVELAGLTGLRVARRQIRWQRAVSLDTLLANIGSRSAFLVLEQAANDAFLADERQTLQTAFPDEHIEEAYVVDLLIAARP
jgi:SAM-dependent methyltransferase